MPAEVTVHLNVLVRRISMPLLAVTIAPGKPMSAVAAVSEGSAAGTANSTTGWTKNPAAASGTAAVHGRRLATSVSRLSPPEGTAAPGGPAATTPLRSGGNPRSRLPPRQGQSTLPHSAAAVQARGSTRPIPASAPPSESCPTPGGRRTDCATAPAGPTASEERGS